MNDLTREWRHGSLTVMASQGVRTTSGEFRLTKGGGYVECVVEGKATKIYGKRVVKFTPAAS